MRSRFREQSGRTGTLITMIMVMALLFASLPAQSSAEQRTLETSYSTPNGSYTVEWTEEWNSELTSEDSFSTMLMLDSQITIYSIMFIHDEGMGLTTRAVYYSLSDVMVSSFEGDVTASAEWQGDDGSYQGAHVITMSGIDFLLYMRVDPAIDENNGPVIQLAAAPRAAFATSLDSLKQSVTLNGEPVLNSVEAQDVLDQVESASSSSDEAEAPADSAPASAAEEEPNPADSELSRSRSRSSILDRISQPATTSDAAAERSAGTYTNTNPEYTVSYPDSWVDMSVSNDTVGQFSVVLDSRTSAIVSFTGRTTTETNRDAYFEELIARESRFPGFVGSVKTEDRLITATWTSETELAVLEYIFVDDTTVVTVMVTVQSQRPEGILSQVQMIELNGEPILPNWDELWSNQE